MCVTGVNYYDDYFFLFCFGFTREKKKKKSFCFSPQPDVSETRALGYI